MDFRGPQALMTHMGGQTTMSTRLALVRLAAPGLDASSSSVQKLNFKPPALMIERCVEWPHRKVRPLKGQWQRISRRQECRNWWPPPSTMPPSLVISRSWALQFA